MIPSGSFLSRQLCALPSDPGVYEMYDKNDQLLYIGKAVDLRRRVFSYFNRTQDQKTGRLIRLVSRIEVHTTLNELEALILEASLIQKEKPPFNIRLKDDKRYPYLALTNESYPGLIVIRRPSDHFKAVFGPYMSARSMRHSLAFVNTRFRLRKCKKKIEFGKKTGRVCLYYQIGQCPGPCTGEIPPEDYEDLVTRVYDFLSGNYSALLMSMEKEMKECARKLQFEAAQKIKEAREHILKISHKQSIELSSGASIDIFSLVCEEGKYNGVVYFVRNGRITGRKNAFYDNPLGMTEPEILDAFMRDLYSRLSESGDLIISRPLPSGKHLLRVWLRSLFNKKITIRSPVSDGERSLMRMARRNGLRLLQEKQLEDLAGSDQNLLKDLKIKLDLPEIPQVIEGFDISNTSGMEPVASMVRFNRGRPDKKEYRHYKIRSVQGPNDFGMIAEAVGRRFQRLLNEGRPLPDLVLVDGGAGQVSSALSVLRILGLPGQPLAGLAKKKEEVFLAGKSSPVKLPRSDPGLQLLQRVRDEAHRFAIGYHRERRRKKAMGKDVLRKT